MDGYNILLCFKSMWFYCVFLWFLLHIPAAWTGKQELHRLLSRHLSSTYTTTEEGTTVTIDIPLLLFIIYYIIY